MGDGGKDNGDDFTLALATKVEETAAVAAAADVMMASDTAAPSTAAAAADDDDDVDSDGNPELLLTFLIALA
jgi:hypothetical protein